MLIINQTRIAEPGGHQNHCALAVDRQRLQRIGIADGQSVGAQALIAQRLFGVLNNLIHVPLAVAEALRHAVHHLAEHRRQLAFNGSKIAVT